MYIVLGGYLRIVGAPSVQTYRTLSISVSYCVFVFGRYRKSRLFACCCRTWICLDMTRFNEKQRQPLIGSIWPACPKNGKSGTHCWGLKVSTQFAQLAKARCDRSTTCSLCRLDQFMLLIVFTKHLITYLTLGAPHNQIKIELNVYRIRTESRAKAGFVCSNPSRST